MGSSLKNFLQGGSYSLTFYEIRSHDWEKAEPGLRLFEKSQVIDLDIGEPRGNSPNMRRS